jgi:hypothetical protein
LIFFGARLFRDVKVTTRCPWGDRWGKGKEEGGTGLFDSYGRDVT